jgi:hypothetical protein
VQSDDQFCCKTIHEQSCSLLGFQQGNLSNAEYYEKFNTRIDVAQTVGLNQVHPAAVDVMVKEIFPSQAYTDLTQQQQEEVDEKAAELYFSYLFLMNSSATNAKLKLSLEEDFAKGVNHYPRDRQKALYLLDKFTKTPKPKEAVSEGSSFATVGKLKKGTKEYNAYWKDKICHLCGEPGHPPYEHSAAKKAKFKKDKAKAEAKGKAKSDDKSTSSKKSSKSKGSSKDSCKMKAVGKAFSTLGKPLAALPEDDSDISDSDDDEQNRFIYDSPLAGVYREPFEKKPRHLTLAQTISEKLIKCLTFASNLVTLAQTVSKKLIKCLTFASKHKTRKAHKKFHSLDLSKCVALDNQSTCDIFNNPEYCEDFREAPHPININSTGGSLRVTQQAKVALEIMKDYPPYVWFDPRAMINILCTANVRGYWPIDYDYQSGQFTVHTNRGSMEFIEIEQGLHLYMPPEVMAAFVNTVAKN